MRRTWVLPLVAGVLAIAANGVRAAGPEGCVAQGRADVDLYWYQPPGNECSYLATDSGGIVAKGSWTVSVWHNGMCGVGTPNVVRSGAAGHNNLLDGAAAAWQGSIAPGSCAIAEAHDGDSFAIIGTISAAL